MNTIGYMILQMLHMYYLNYKNPQKHFSGKKSGRVSKSEKCWTSVNGWKERREEEMNSCGSCMKRYKRVTLVAELIIEGGKI